MKKRKKEQNLRRRAVTALFLAVAIAILGGIGYSSVCARVAHVERVTIVSADLPQAMDGLKILYVTDIDLTGFSTPQGVARLFKRLKALAPDVLILGGDYANDSLLDGLNHAGGEEKLSRERRALFQALKFFDAPLGKYAVAGDHEAKSENLAAELSLGGFTLLSDGAVSIERDGAQVALVGFKDSSAGGTDYGAIAQHFSNADFVIACAHNPSAIGAIVTSEASDSGAWCDLALSGHNHGGQVVLFGRTMLQLTQAEARRLSGWTKESGTWVLVSEGLGCESVNLRLGTRAEVHLITLRRGE